MAGNDDILNIQRDIANRQMAERIARDRRLQQDIRPMIARSGWYNPENDMQGQGTEYPKFVRGLVANNQDEELAILGKQVAAAKAVSVNIEQIGQTQEPVRVKRKYTKRAKVEAEPLPDPLK